MIRPGGPPPGLQDPRLADSDAHHRPPTAYAIRSLRLISESIARCAMIMIMIISGPVSPGRAAAAAARRRAQPEPEAWDPSPGPPAAAPAPGPGSRWAAGVSSSLKFSHVTAAATVTPGAQASQSQPRSQPRSLSHAGTSESLPAPGRCQCYRSTSRRQPTARKPVTGSVAGVPGLSHGRRRSRRRPGVRRRRIRVAVGVRHGSRRGSGSLSHHRRRSPGHMIVMPLTASLR